MRRRVGRRSSFRPLRRRSIFWWPRMFLWGGFNYLMYESMVYKLRRDDVLVIERETGKKMKELSEGELVSAVKRLGIRKLEISSDEKAIIERS
jgi:hypothetical protein